MNLRTPGERAFSIAPAFTRLALLSILLTLLAGCSPGRGLEAVLLLKDMAAGDRPTLYKRLVPEPQATAVTYAGRERDYAGDLYLSRKGSRGALLLVPGAAEAGKDDPRLIALARSLARARFAVLVPDLPSLRALQVNAGNIREIADSLGWLSSQPSLAPRGRAGIVAFSYGAGPAILAAMEPDVRRNIEVILAVGPYFDLNAVLTFFTTGWFRHADRWHYLEPNTYGKWVFVLANLDRIPLSDREIVRAMAQRRKEDPGADLSDLSARLSPGGQDLYTFITNTDPQAAPRLIAGLPEEIRREIAALDLAGKDFSRLRAHLLLLHGTGDDIIPYPQSIALDNALPPGQADLYLVKGLFHVDLKPGWRDLWRLWRAVDSLLSYRDSP